MKDATMPDRNRGFGFVKFRDPSSAEELLNDPEPLVLNGKTVSVQWLLHFITSFALFSCGDSYCF